MFLRDDDRIPALKYYVTYKEIWQRTHFLCLDWSHASQDK